MHARGLTILEAVVSVSIFTVVMASIVTSIIFFYRANASSLEQAYQVESARRGVELLVRDLREATYGDNGAYPIANIGSTTMTFFSDTDKDAVVEQITYSVIGTEFYRYVLDSSGTPPTYSGVGATSTVSQYVRNFEEGKIVFHYFDVDGNEISDYAEVDEVRSVTIELVVNILPIRAPEEFTLRSSATIRNLRN